MLYVNFTYCSQFSIDLILAISCGTIHKLISKNLLKIRFMLQSVSTSYLCWYTGKTYLKVWKSLILKTLVEEHTVLFFKNPLIYMLCYRHIYYVWKICQMHLWKTLWTKCVMCYGQKSLLKYTIFSDSNFKKLTLACNCYILFWSFKRLLR